MKLRRVKADLTNLPAGRVDKRRLDATTEEDIARQQQADDADSMQDAAKYARRVRKRLGLTQLEFSVRKDTEAQRRESKESTGMTGWSDT